MEARSQYKRGLWTVEEDQILMDYIRVHGKGRWNRVAKLTGLKRCGKSCRLRWINYLSPSVKKGDFTEEEDDLIIRLHKLLGNRWSLIAGRVPGRTDNQVKNHWNTHLSKKLGITKRQQKFVVSSPTVPENDKEEADETNTHSNNANIELPGYDSNGGVIVNDYSSQSVVAEFSNTPNDCLVGSSWFSNDYLSLGYPSLMDLTDMFPIEFLWDGL
ncbi:hypothetical protein AQUCO_00200170v1 [Aquilegia coerulea]|uniref:Uncharacterized protein n=1 Tax=Aquilegia coerulea TaxID=218851 RepID=A0A2G5F1U0_AQUCA|nr:hypothetical protein AQUCO_00200170v1 [Aquilegia coerulea]